MKKDPVIRLATRADCAALTALIELSSRRLQTAHYSRKQLDRAIGTVFGVDTALIDDATYFAVEDEGILVGCGGWSRRATLFGSDRRKGGQSDPLLDPATEPARIRAFFTHPDHVRRGIGRRLIVRSERAAAAEGFSRMTLVATLAGVPLYAAAGYSETERYEVSLCRGETLPVVAMAKDLWHQDLNP